MIIAIFEQFVKATLLTIVVREIMERIFDPQVLDKLFVRTSVKNEKALDN